jgi:hypothetical protein
MNMVTRITMTSAVCAAFGLSGATFSQSALAGSLNKCDQARVAARNTVLNKYNELLLSLNKTIARANAAGLNPNRLPYDDADNKSQLIDMIALKESLEGQEAIDVGYADQKIARECRDDSESIADLVKTADNIAMLGISAVLPKSMVNIDAADRDPSQVTGGGKDLRLAQPLPLPGQESRQTEPQ